MKRLFTSAIWPRVILVLALVFLAWSIKLIVSVKHQQAEFRHDVGLIDKLSGVAQAVRALETGLVASGPDSVWKWRTLYNDYRTRRAEFDPGDPVIHDLQLNLIRLDSIVIRIDGLRAYFLQAANEPVLQKNWEADFRRELNAATTELQNAIQKVRWNIEPIAVAMAGNWNALFVLVLVACALVFALALGLVAWQREMAATQQADGVLHESNEQIRRAFAHAPIGMALSAPDGNFLQVNQAFCELLGYAESELLRCNPAELAHPDDLAAQRDLTGRLLRNEIPHFQLEKRYRTRQNAVVYTLLQMSLVREAGGAPRHFVEQVVDISERKKEEIARRQSEARFRELVENITEVFWLTDPAKNEMLYISPVYEKVWGRTCQSLYESPRQWFDAIHPEDRERVLKAALHKQIIGRYDEIYRIQRPDGEIRWIRDRAFPVRDEQGSVYRLAGIVADVTARQNTEAALQESEQRWNLALAVSGEGVWDWEVPTNKVFYSKRWKELLGYQEHELGDSLDELYSRLHPQDMNATIALLEKHLRGETPAYISEHRMRCKNGAYKWILAHGQVVARTADGKPWRIVGTHVDITARKQEQEAVAKQNALLRSIVDSMGEGVMIADSNGKILFCNSAAERMVGMGAPDSGAGEGVEKSNLYLPDKITPFPDEQNPMRRALQGESTPAVEMFVRNHQRPDGLWLSVTGTPLQDENGAPLGRVVFRDVTALKEAVAILPKNGERFRRQRRLRRSGQFRIFARARRQWHAAAFDRPGHQDFGTRARRGGMQRRAGTARVRVQVEIAGERNALPPAD
ncbi:MAG: hypothetical protein ALAOOOJD_00069 [bacterium]|nr:hypothetical protein [bacterium]